MGWGTTNDWPLHRLAFIPHPPSPSEFRADSLMERQHLPNHDHLSENQSKQWWTKVNSDELWHISTLYTITRGSNYRMLQTNKNWHWRVRRFKFYWHTLTGHIARVTLIKRIIHYWITSITSRKILFVCVLTYCDRLHLSSFVKTL